MLGIGDIIGAGIFVLTGLAAAQYGGPAIVLSFVLAALACGFAGLCYSEFASMIPVSGSAYTYAYATLGELVAFLIGCALTLEFAPDGGGQVTWRASCGPGDRDPPVAFRTPGTLLGKRPPDTSAAFGAAEHRGSRHRPGFYRRHGPLQPPALLIVLAITAVVTLGIRESTNLNTW
jgi:APA family basic amino acid/polyamine antiporter